jgi:hypothetical protein
MTVGTIGAVSIHAYTDYITVSFVKPSNTTKYVVTINNSSLFIPITKTYSFDSFPAGSTVTCTVNGLTSGQSYYVSVTPYNIKMHLHKILLNCHKQK